MYEPSKLDRFKISLPEIITKTGTLNLTTESINDKIYQFTVL